MEGGTGRRNRPRPPKPDGVESNSRQHRHPNTLTRTERERAIRALMHDLPADTDLAELLFSLIARGTNALGLMTPLPTATPEERHAAIVGAAAIEHGLKRSIGLHFADDADYGAIFDVYPNAPLSSFAARTLMGRALGVIDDRTQGDLNVIRRIRNIFAHSIHSVTFRTAEVADLVSDLKVLNDPTWAFVDGEYTTPRARYLVTCAIHVVALHRYQFIRPSDERKWLAEALLGASL